MHVDDPAGDNIIIVLLFFSLDLVKGKSYGKVTSVLLLLIFGTFNTMSSSIPCWVGISSWEILDANPSSILTFLVRDSDASMTAKI